MIHQRSILTSGCLAAILCLTAMATPGFTDDEVQVDDKLATQLDSEIKNLEQVAKNNPCREAFLIAIRDPRVRQLFLQKLRNRCYVLRDICCLQLPSIPEQASVLFNFDCAPHCACLLDPQFLVIVNKIDKKVLKIIDPYDGPTKPCISIRTAAPKPVDCSSDEGCKEFGVAAYHAIFDGTAVYVFASGVHPRSGYQNCLQPGPEDIIPPIYEFKITPPQVGAAVITPFTVCAKFKMQYPPRSMTVRDAKGKHTVAVHRP